MLPHKLVRYSHTYKIPIAIFALCIGIQGISVNAALASALPLSDKFAKLPAWAQETSKPVKRALVIGIDNYQYAEKLATPSYDATLVAATLKTLDPSIVITKVNESNLTRDSLLDEIEKFSESLRPGEIALVYFSGHGVESDYVNYLVPINAKLSEAGREGFVYISLPFLLERIQQSGAGLAVVILDACRSDPFDFNESDDDLLPFAQGEAVAPVASITKDMPESPLTTENVVTKRSKGLFKMDSPPGILVAYAASQRQASYSLFKGEAPSQGSIYTRQILNYMRALNKPIDRVFNMAGVKIDELTRGRQKPMISSMGVGDILFLENEYLANDELELWTLLVSDTQEDQQPAALREFIRLYPAGVHSGAARNRLQFLTNGIEQAQSKNRTETLGNVASSTRISGIEGDEPIVSVSGALKSSSIHRDDVSARMVNASHDVFVRASPRSGAERIGAIRKNSEVVMLDSEVRPGWAKVQLSNGIVGFVGSTSPTSLAPSKILAHINLKDDDIPNLAVHPSQEAWKRAQRNFKMIVKLDVAPSSDENAWRARSTSLLRALRIRASLIAQGFLSEQIKLTFDSPGLPIDEASVRLYEVSK